MRRRARLALALLASGGAAIAAEPPTPALHATFQDSTFGASIRRVTDGSQLHGAGRVRHYYSKSQPWNADRTLAILFDGDGNTILYDARRWSPLAVLDIEGSDPEIQWHPERRDAFYYLDEVADSDDVRGLFMYEIRARRSRLLRDFPEYDSVRGRLEGNLDRAGRYYALVGERGRRREAFVLDLHTLVTGPRVPIEESHVDDWISMTPSGELVVAMGEDRSRVYDREMKLLRELPEGSFGHGDLCTRADGAEVLVYDGADRELDGEHRNINEIELLTGRERALTRIDWKATPHVSCRNLDRPGWALISTQGADGNPANADFEIFWLSLDEAREVRPIAHHHSRRDGYFTEQHAVPSRDGRLVMFASNWGGTSVWSYVIDLDASPEAMRIHEGAARETVALP